MKDRITHEALWSRRQALARELARMAGRAEDQTPQPGRGLSRADQHRARINELDYLMGRIGPAHSLATRPPPLPPGTRPFRSRPGWRYRKPGATTDIVAFAYRTPGIDREDLVSAVFAKNRPRGTKERSIRKMVDRLIREGYASQVGSGLHLNEVCRKAWEASPLYPES